MMESTPSFYIPSTDPNSNSNNNSFINTNGLLFDDQSTDLLSLDIYSSMHFQQTDLSDSNQIQYQSNANQEFSLLTALDTNMNSPSSNPTESHFSINQSASAYNIHMESLDQHVEHDLLNLNPVYIKYDQSQPENTYYNPTIVEESHEAEKLFTSTYFSRFLIRALPIIRVIIKSMINFE